MTNVDFEQQLYIDGILLEIEVRTFRTPRKVATKGFDGGILKMPH